MSPITAFNFQLPLSFKMFAVQKNNLGAKCCTQFCRQIPIPVQLKTDFQILNERILF